LPKGVHYYKFIVDGEWKYNPDEPSTPDSTGNINNYIDTTTVKNNNYNPENRIANEFEGNEKKDMDEEETTNRPVKKQVMASSITKKSALFGLSLDSEAPSLPPYYENALFLNKKSQRINSIKQNHGKFKEFAFLIKLLDNPLVPPTHAEVCHMGIHEGADKLNKGYEILFTTYRFKGKYCTYKLYSKRQP